MPALKKPSQRPDWWLPVSILLGIVLWAWVSYRLLILFDLFH
jgi:hypothetical protein